MARIRSVHPGLFTDEAFASLSNAARVLLIGIWTECDDHGVFEWKPLSLKMKVFPADAVTQDKIEEMLAELTGVACIKRIEMDGKGYGLVRNFCLWQRPKKPSYRYPFPGHFSSYVGSSTTAPPLVENQRPASTPPVPHQSPTKGEMSAQMKEEGGRKKEKKTSRESLERESPATDEKSPDEFPSPSAPDSPSQDRPPPKIASQGLKGLGGPLPETWTPDDELCEDVKREFGMTDEDIRTELLAFHAHHAAAGSYSANWRSSFFTFCKRWKEHRDKQAAPRVQLTKSPRNGGTTHAQEDQRDSLVAIARRNAESGISFGPKPTGLPAGTRQQAGDDAVRMLPEG